MGRFDGQVAWITGGGSGIGRAVALELAREGADVAVSGRREDRLVEVVGQIEALGRRGLAVPCDVTDEGSVREAAARVVAELGKLDVAIANAGFSVAGRVEEVTDEAWRRQFDVNVFGALHTARAALPELRKTRGRLALVGSVAGFVSAPKNGPYNASKAAIRSIGETLSAELVGTGVTCTTVHPGFVESEIGQVDNEGVFHADRRDKRPSLLMWRTEPAARAIVGAVAARKRQFIFTGHGRILVALSRLSPGLVATLAARTGGRSGQRRVTTAST